MCKKKIYTCRESYQTCFYEWVIVLSITFSLRPFYLYITTFYLIWNCVLKQWFPKFFFYLVYWAVSVQWRYKYGVILYFSSHLISSILCQISHLGSFMICLANSIVFWLPLVFKKSSPLHHKIPSSYPTVILAQDTWRREGVHWFLSLTLAALNIYSWWARRLLCFILCFCSMAQLLRHWGTCRETQAREDATLVSLHPLLVPM